MGLFSMSLDLAPKSLKENDQKSFKIRTITYNSEATINNCSIVQTEDNITTKGKQISKKVEDNSLILLVFFLPIASSRACCERRHVLIIQVQEVPMNISATKQNIFIKLE